MGVLGFPLFIIGFLTDQIIPVFTTYEDCLLK
jgi:hypothetical protein